MADSYIINKGGQSGGNSEITENLNYSNIGLGFMAHGGTYMNKDRLYIGKSYSGFGVMYSKPIDFTNIKKIIVTGEIKDDASGRLTNTGYFNISPEIFSSISEASDDWTMFVQVKGALDFIQEIDTDNITGENYIHFAVHHGPEINSYTSFLFVDSITFVYG